MAALLHQNQDGHYEIQGDQAPFEQLPCQYEYEMLKRHLYRMSVLIVVNASHLKSSFFQQALYHFPLISKQAVNALNQAFPSNIP